MSTAAVPSRARTANLVAILATCGAAGIGMGLTLPLLGLILERRGYPGFVNGLNLATAGLAAVLITPRVPGWISRFGASYFLAGALVVVALAMLAISVAPDLGFFFATRFVLSAALNSLFVVSEFWINQIADERNRGRMVALYAMCLSGGFAVGPTILVAIGTHGMAPFLAGAGMMLLALVPVLAVRRSAPRIEEHRGGMGMRGLFRLAPIALLAGLVFGAIDGGMAGLLPVYAVRSGYSEGYAALFVTALMTGGIVLQYPLGYLADHMNRRHVLALCTAAGVAGAALIPFLIGHPLAVAIVLVLWGGLAMGIYTLGLTMLGQRFQGAELAGANATYVMLYAVGMIAGPSLEGVALDAWNPHGLMAALGGICLVYFIVLLWPATQRAPEN